MTRPSTLLPLLLFATGTFVTVQVLGRRLPRQVNKCGSNYVNIDRFYNNTIRQDMIPCCNRHDICYNTCRKIKSDCDSILYFCLANICNGIPGGAWTGDTQLSQITCDSKSEGKLLFKFVFTSGAISYTTAQKNCLLRG